VLPRNKETSRVDPWKWNRGSTEKVAWGIFPSIFEYSLHEGRVWEIEVSCAREMQNQFNAESDEYINSCFFTSKPIRHKRAIA
jgi:hypothetical protein